MINLTGNDLKEFNTYVDSLQNPKLALAITAVIMTIVGVLGFHNVTIGEFLVMTMFVFLILHLYITAFNFWPELVLVASVLLAVLMWSIWPSTEHRERELYQSAKAMDERCAQLPEVYGKQCAGVQPQEFCAEVEHFDTYPTNFKHECSTFIAPGITAGDTRPFFLGGKNSL